MVAVVVRIARLVAAIAPASPAIAVVATTTIVGIVRIASQAFLFVLLINLELLKARNEAFWGLGLLRGWLIKDIKLVFLESPCNLHMPLQKVDLPAPGGPTTSSPKGMAAGRTRSGGGARARVSRAAERACAACVWRGGANSRAERACVLGGGPSCGGHYGGASKRRSEIGG